MPFPETPKSLIQRLADVGTADDWRQFLNDYWGPICRFAAARAPLSDADAEDVASQTFEAVLTNRLLARWIVERSAKLRTLLCSVVRNILSNRGRVQQGRARLLRERADQGAGVPLLEALEVSDAQVDEFYAAWVGDLLEQTVETLLQEYHSAGKGDYFRVLYGRICEEMTTPEVAAAIGITVTTAENYFRAAKKRLGECLESEVRRQVARYCREKQCEDEFRLEWGRLGDYLSNNGGLEQIVRRACETRLGFERKQRKARGISSALSRIFVPKAGELDSPRPRTD
jgi:RNA polymerase sigma factor (sigma-70 family)